MSSRLIGSLSRSVRAMGKGCITATKYLLFLFNLLFFVSLPSHDHIALYGPAFGTRPSDPLVRHA